MPLRELKRLRINCRQLKIYKICINDLIDCDFEYHDPTLEVCQDDARAKQKSVDAFSQAFINAVQSVEGKNRGEITINLPSYLTANIAEGKFIKVAIEFGVENPLGGIHFVVPKNSEGSFAERGAHLFTSGFQNCSRLWFPCIDSYYEPCLWKLEFTVDASMTAISCGELTETVYSSDMKRKTFHYQLTVPSCAPDIGLAVGPFEVYVDPNMHEVTHFCLPQLLPLLKETCAFLHETFEFYEELLSFRYPYPCYKQVFVDQAYCDSQSYSTMTILNANILHSKHIIDQTYETKRILAHSLAKQFFGSFISKAGYADAWLTYGISGFLGALYHKKTFGNNEYRYWVQKLLDDVITYEQKYGGFPLDPCARKNGEPDFYFSTKSFQTQSPLYVEAYTKKSILVMRMLEDRIGPQLLLQVFNKLLTLATIASSQKVTPSNPNAWSNTLLSANSFSKAIYTVTGKDISAFLEQWVNQGCHAKFTASFVFNRKRNTVELEIKQLDTGCTGIRRYMGPLMVWIQELDGSFKHNLQIEENTTKHDITCHSKSRRNKKKKIPLCTGEEVDMDLSAMDADSPVLWIRVDPDMQLLRQVVIEQPDYQWQYQLRYERDVTAQVQALEHLDRLATQSTRKTLQDVIENEQTFYRIRCEATMCMRSVANQMAANWNGPPALMNTFKKLFGSFSCPNIIKLNNFSNFQLYYLQKAMPVAMAGLRTMHGICQPEIVRFLLDLFKYNDNSKNKFSDNYYRASLITALSETVTPVLSAVLARASHAHTASSEALSSETKLILEEVTRYFNLEKLMPCYKHTVTVSCLKAIRHLQKMGHLPSNPAFFKEYAQYGVFSEVRLAAIEALIDITKSEQRREDLDYLLDLVEFDPVPSIKHEVTKMLTLNPPFTKKDTSHALNTEDLVDRIWKMMNTLPHDTQLRCALVDLYFVLYGRSRPAVLPKPELSVVFNLKERTAISGISEDVASTGDVNSFRDALDGQQGQQGKMDDRNSNSDEVRRSLFGKRHHSDDEDSQDGVEKIFKSSTGDVTSPSKDSQRNSTSGSPFASTVAGEKHLPFTAMVGNLGELNVHESANLNSSISTVARGATFEPFTSSLHSPLPGTSASIHLPSESDRKSKEERRKEKKEKKKKKKKHKHKHKHKHHHRDLDDPPMASTSSSTAALADAPLQQQQQQQHHQQQQQSRGMSLAEELEEGELSDRDSDASN